VPSRAYRSGNGLVDVLGRSTRNSGEDRFVAGVDDISGLATTAGAELAVDEMFGRRKI
jgi:hypothetical protein